MNQQQPNYKFYATLLDSFSWYLKSEKEESFREFIDKVNRVPFTSEAAERGTSFNRLVDEVVYNNYILSDDTTLFDGFDFPSDVVIEMAQEFHGAVSQVEVSGTVNTKYGAVLLYGYIDELKADKVYDIKTTKNYELGKYINNWQHKVYLYCLLGTGINTFQYTVTDFEHIYKEEYVWRGIYELDLRLICERLIEFLNDYRNMITDKKVFAEI